MDTMNGVTAAPFIANTTYSIAQQVDNALQFGFFGALTSSSRWMTAEAALRESPNIKLVVGHSIGGSVASELQKPHPELTPQRDTVS